MARDLYATLDLNLLKTLTVLSQERNMRRAAERLFVTQPAVSQALGRLRHHFGEELFIRTPTGLEPTAFTERLMARVAPLLDDLSSVLNERQVFDPTALREDLTLAVSPQLSSFLGGRILDRLHREAPGAGMQLTYWGDDSLQRIAQGDLQLGVNIEIENTPKQIMLERLGQDRFTCYVREEHPLLARPGGVRPRDLDGCELATLIIPDWNRREVRSLQLLAEFGSRARVKFRSDQPAAIREAVRRSDLVFPATSFLDGRDLEGLKPLRILLDEEIFVFPVAAYLHQKNRRNPLTLWLCAMLRELLADRD